MPAGLFAISSTVFYTLEMCVKAAALIYTFMCVLEAPQHGHRFADAHIMVIEVAKACKGHS